MVFGSNTLYKPGEVFRLRLKYPLFGKDRQRFNRKTGTVYQPKEYRNDQAAVRKQLKAQWDKRGILDVPVQIELLLCGHSRGDLDNTSGGLLDAMKGVVLYDDSKKWVPRLSADWSWAKDNDSVWLIRLATLDTKAVQTKVGELDWSDFETIFGNDGLRS